MLLVDVFNFIVFCYYIVNARVYGNPISVYWYLRDWILI